MGVAEKKMWRKFTVISFSALALLCAISGYFDLNEILKKVILNMLLCLFGTGLRYTIWLISVGHYPTFLRSTVSTLIHSLGTLEGLLAVSSHTYCIQQVLFVWSACLLGLQRYSWWHRYL